MNHDDYHVIIFGTVKCDVSSYQIDAEMNPPGYIDIAVTRLPGITVCLISVPCDPDCVTSRQYLLLFQRSQLKIMCLPLDQSLMYHGI